MLIKRINKNKIMKQPELTKEESELYLRIVREGNFDDMFDFAYAIGRERFAKEQLKEFKQQANQL